MAAAADEWRDAFRRARNATIGWTVLVATAVVVATLQTVDLRQGTAVGIAMVASVLALYGLWRLWRLGVIRRDLAQGAANVGRVYVALFSTPTMQYSADVVAVWLKDPRTDDVRSHPPDSVYVAEYSESDRTDSFYGAVVREAWTPVRPDGTPQRGRWFRTADNLVLTVRPAGPFAWLMTSRGLPNVEGIVPAPDFDRSELTGLDQPVGFRHLGRAVLLRVLGGAAALLLFLQME